jgi:transcriptional regulator with XRE-family HTH domain
MRSRFYLKAQRKNLHTLNVTDALMVEQLGQALGVSKGCVSQLERRGANLESATLARVAQMLGHRSINQTLTTYIRPRAEQKRSPGNRTPDLSGLTPTLTEETTASQA